MSNSRVEFTVSRDADGAAIEDALHDREGVQLATFDPETGVVEVRHGESLISTAEIKSTVRDLGYDVE
ncbi:heavy-metal-associated domain-containing protein [Halobacterium sp. CBA1126]|uniref:heavy-metal-associated domain-containing protein n=1 Tax=Halobacterium sp. CBA1126 TaxID=2668074 RepID=UPI0012FC09D1|nr:heavy-metal-associated domain-containing protein [Halobacterium sp. CBA1126]MUV60351.1 copper resistance protein CopZ [Halobacterium sp. CBA1126]